MESNVHASALPVVRDIATMMKSLDFEFIGKNSAGGGPDLIPFRPFNIPAFELAQDGTDYFDFHHTADDTLDKIDPKKLRQNVATYAVFSYMAANAKTRLVGKSK